MFRVIVLFRNQRSAHSYAQAEVMLGRHLDNDLVLRDSIASRRHCRILANQGCFYLEDTGSRNGFELDGRQLGGRRVRLLPYQKVRIGETLFWIETESTDPPRPRSTALVAQSSDDDQTPSPAPGFSPMVRTRSNPPPPSREDKPTRPSLRQLIDSVLPTAAQFHAFAVDYYPKIASSFTPNMDRLSMESLLLARASAAEILRHLRKAHPDESADAESLLEFESE